VGSTSDVVPYYSAADIFILPSYHEGLPLVLLEAMSVGLPVIASDVGGVPDVVDHEVNGFLVPPKDVNSLARIIEWVVAHPDRAKEIGIRAQAVIAKDYSLERMCGDYIVIYRSLVQ
jgi:glycosyltransferase involved in cell wall biosynthesis